MAELNEVKVVDNMEDFANEVSDMIADNGDESYEQPVIDEAEPVKADNSPANEDYMKKFGMALACGALGAVGAHVANDILIPAAKKACHWIGGKIKDAWHNRKKAAETEGTEPEVETADEQKKGTKKK